uniref:Candidate secreted effector n=1 Tax=Meloidogyne incognita TaxID=6306 RepID=A0A914NKC0_MELIC
MSSYQSTIEATSPMKCQPDLATPNRRKNSKQMPGEFHTPAVRTPTKPDSKQMPEELLQMPKQMLEHSP